MPTDDEGEARISTELGLPVANGFLTVDSGGRERPRYERTSAGAWETRAGAVVWERRDARGNDEPEIRLARSGG